MIFLSRFVPFLKFPQFSQVSQVTENVTMPIILHLIISTISLTLKCNHLFDVECILWIFSSLGKI